MQKINDLFDDHIRQALNHYQDPKWLGKHSPLASPYFLGKALHEQHAEDANTAVIQGKTLQTLLFHAAKKRVPEPLPDDREGFLEFVNKERLAQGAKGPAYHLLLLDLKYFRHYFPLKAFPQAKQEPDICEFLGVSRSSFFTHLKTARALLGESLLTHISPALRLEHPPKPQADLIGQEMPLAHAMDSLQRDHTLLIHGAGGCGKTTLGASIANNWSPAPVFWFTFWPSLEGQLDSLLFALGHFLNLHGASHLWTQLITNNGHVAHLNTAVSHLRTDFAQLSTKPLLCFDELDYLLNNPEIRSPEAELIQTFLERLRGMAPLLLISRQNSFLADNYIQLEGLSLEESQALFESSNVTMTPEGIDKLHQFTAGNPRLLKLCTPVLEAGEINLHQLSNESSLNGLFSSLWHTLTKDEHQFAQQLSVFRGSAPLDAWQTEQKPALDRLQTLSLLQSDNEGGIRLVPIFSALIQNDPQKISADTNEKSHNNAAVIRLERGEYSAAVYHLMKAGEPEQAIMLWYVHRHREIAKGQGSQMYALLQNIPQRRLSHEGQQALALSLAEICELLGQPQQGISHLDNVNWPQSDLRSIDAETLKGKFLNALGKSEEALGTFNNLLSSLSQFLNKQVHIHTWRGYVFHQQRDVQAALAEARLAQYEAELFVGLVQKEQGKYDEAFLSFQKASALAISLDHFEGIAKVNWNLSILQARQGKIGKALEHAHIALEHFEEINDRFNVERVRNSIIGIYFNQGRFDEVIENGEQSLTYFEEANMPYWASVTAATLSEAYLELNNLAMARKRAHQVLTFEEPLSMPYALYTLGLVSRKEQELDSANAYLNQACELAQQSEDQYLLAYAERALGEIYMLRSEKEAAGEYLNRALDYFTQMKNNAEIQATNNLLAQINS